MQHKFIHVCDSSGVFIFIKAKLTLANTTNFL